MNKIEFYGATSEGDLLSFSIGRRFCWIEVEEFNCNAEINITKQEAIKLANYILENVNDE